MIRQPDTGHKGSDEKGVALSQPGGVKLTGPSSRPRINSSRPSQVKSLEAARLQLDHGLSTEAESQLVALIKAARHDAPLLARAHCMLSAALEVQGRYRESLAAIQAYEAPEMRAGLDPETSVRLRMQTGLAYYNMGDHPKAIALLNTARREASENGLDAEMGTAYVELSRVYRSINEYPIARDYAQKALDYFRGTGDWRGLAEAYFGIALADMLKGEYETALSNFEQALKLVGDRSAPHLLGKIYVNMAGTYWFLKRPQEGIRHLEKGIDYYERTEHKVNAAHGYNNLGINLMLIGEWKRAQQALERALVLASEISEQGAQVAMVLDSLGELCMLRGDLVEAQSYLERAVVVATEYGNEWYAGQALHTLGRCHLAIGDVAGAFAKGQRALALAERIGDRQAISNSRLLLAETHLRRGEWAECAAELQKVTNEIADSSIDLALVGEAQRLYGLLAMAQTDATLAAHHFGRSVSIFETLGDRYHRALAHYELGRAYAAVQPERAAEYLAQASRTFRELGARLDLARAEAAFTALDRAAPERRAPPPVLNELITLRLAEAATSRDLLLRELAAVLHQESNAREVIIVDMDEDHRYKLVSAHGCTDAETARVADRLNRAKSDSEREQFALEHNAIIIPLRATNAPPALLFIAPRARTVLPGGASIQPLLRVVELGMDACAFRGLQRAGGVRGAQQGNPLTGGSLLPGFIYSSPAMMSLIEEMHKIRSSDVTVLVTGESGTGKELVARAIHSLTERRSKAFIPFNCTAMPKDLIESYLFGYRRGAFTGAVADSLGVIRTAERGTLFLDEIADLPLDVQPKLLRFLQNGEIQPLGEQRPSSVDVRIIAATNTDLEEVVAQGRFREDLYYRLNVIRLRVPPLRDRRSEIPTLVSHYINHYSTRFGRRGIQIRPQAVDLLMVCDWPGNVRQLCNEIQRVVARAEDGMVITPDHLSPELRSNSIPLSRPALVPSMSLAAHASQPDLKLADAVARLECQLIAKALRKHAGNITRTARELGLTRRGLQLKLERYHLNTSG